MRLTNNEAFIRFVGTNHKTDYGRLDDWVLKLADWKKKGLKNIHFFIHQDMGLAPPLLSTHFITKLNKKLGCNLNIPKSLAKTGPKLS